MVLFLALFACAPVYRFPGPLTGLGGTREVHGERSEEVARHPRRGSGDGAAVVAAAQGFVGQPSLLVEGEKYRWDCSGLVEAVMAATGGSYRGSTADMLEQAKEAGVVHRKAIPMPGDLIFFDNTYDRNGNGWLDDALSHVALVESAERDGTVTFIHLGSKGVVRLHMNLKHPEERLSPEGAVWNDYLRNRRPGDSPRTHYLAGELWAAFASPWKEVERVAGR